MNAPAGGWRGGRRRLARLALACLAPVAACAPGANLPPLPADTGASYHLGPGDQVRVITFGGDQLTGEFRVSDEGTIAVPLLGPVQAAGLTPVELSRRLVKELQEHKLIKDPSVSVEVISYRPFFVLGEVNKPGRYPYEPGMTVLTAVSIAGGFTYRAITDYASIVRNQQGHPVEGRVGRETVVRPGDVINIYERIF
jgi:polysaccharide export outer membrane protein